MKFNYQIKGQTYTIEIESTETGYKATIGQKNYQVEIAQAEQGIFRLLIDGQRKSAHWAIDGPQKRWVAFEGKSYLVEKAIGPKRSGGPGGSGGGFSTPRLRC